MMWPEQDSTLERVFHDAEEDSRPWKMVAVYRHKACIEHTEFGPDFYRDLDGTKHLVTPEVVARWEAEGVNAIKRVNVVGTCASNGCDPDLPGAEKWRSHGRPEGFTWWECNKPPPSDEEVRTFYGPGTNPHLWMWQRKRMNQPNQ